MHYAREANAVNFPTLRRLFGERRIHVDDVPKNEENMQLVVHVTLDEIPDPTTYLAKAVMDAHGLKVDIEFSIAQTRGDDIIFVPWSP